MNVNKRYITTTKHLTKAAEVAAFLNSLDNDPDDPMPLFLANAVSMARVAADGLVHLVRRIECEMATEGDHREIMGSLFPPTPSDRAVAARDLREMVDDWFRKAIETDDTGVPPKPKPTTPKAKAKAEPKKGPLCPTAREVRDLVAETGIDNLPLAEVEGWSERERLDAAEWAELVIDGDEEAVLPTTVEAWIGRDELASDADAGDDDSPEDVEENAEDPKEDLSAPAAIKARLFQGGETGLEESAIFDQLEGDGEGEYPRDEIEAALWALIHTGEVTWSPTTSRYSAASPGLEYDLAAMLSAQPELGTEDGLATGDIDFVMAPADVLTPSEVERTIADIVALSDGSESDAPMSPKDLADHVANIRAFVEGSGPVTRFEILSHFGSLLSGMDVSEEVDRLIESGALEKVDGALSAVEKEDDPLDGDLPLDEADDELDDDD